ncbi:hypothetical protein [Paenarthrobacter sp. NCHU4564]|uniref:hypothetical protein n=1 Tax=Paenarthrobacter sp. NCHU4564 TaxID=3451353 RepID=UPI003F9AC24D
MKSRTALLERKPVARVHPLIGSHPVPAVSAQPMGPDCEDECPYCHGPETD